VSVASRDSDSQASRISSMNPIRVSTGGGGARTTWRVLGLLSALAGVTCFVLAGPFLVQTFGFVERHLSPDQHITLGTDYVHKVLMFNGALLLGVGIAMTLGARKLSEMIHRLTSPNDLTDRQFSIALFWSSFIAGLILVGLWFLQGIVGLNLLHMEDGPLETLTAILFIVSSFLTFRAAMLHRRQSADHRKVVAVFLVGIAIVFLFFGLEEISWGQRLFGWSTPAVLERINDQRELNVHNLSNWLLAPLYRWGTLALALLTAAGWLWLSRFRETPLRFLIPHGAMAGLLVLMLLFGTYQLQNELLEELGAVFALFYALTAIRASRPRHAAT
jgi:hypothetical protein